VPLLQRYLKIADQKAVQELHAFHVPLFQKVPRPSSQAFRKCETSSSTNTRQQHR
jgi:hypothetical protein